MKIAAFSVLSAALILLSCVSEAANTPKAPALVKTPKANGKQTPKSPATPRTPRQNPGTPRIDHADDMAQNEPQEKPKYRMDSREVLLWKSALPTDLSGLPYQVTPAPLLNTQDADCALFYALSFIGAYKAAAYDIKDPFDAQNTFNAQKFLAKMQTSGAPIECTSNISLEKLHKEIMMKYMVAIEMNENESPLTALAVSLDGNTHLEDALWDRTDFTSPVPILIVKLEEGSAISPEGIPENLVLPDKYILQSVIMEKDYGKSERHYYPLLRQPLLKRWFKSRSGVFKHIHRADFNEKVATRTDKRPRFIVYEREDFIEDLSRYVSLRSVPDAVLFA